MKLSRRPLAFTSSKGFLKSKKNLEIVSLPHFLHKFINFNKYQSIYAYTHYAYKKESKTIYQGKEYSALLTYFLGTFDCLAHNHAFAKLHAYNFYVEYLKLMNHLTERKQGLTINDQFSTWMHILFGVLHTDLF